MEKNAVLIDDLIEVIKKFRELRSKCEDNDFCNLGITDRAWLQTQGIAIIDRVASGSVYQKLAEMTIQKGEHDWNVLHQLQGILEALLGHLTVGSFVPVAEGRTSQLAPLDTIIKMCQRFHKAVLGLRKHPRSRDTLAINDEYDVQYLLQSFLALEIDDIRPEEWTPSHGGKSSRMDFLLINEQIVVETKMTRDNLRDVEIGKELKIDIMDYRSHPKCKTLICLVYDPGNKISNPTGLENDLTGQHNHLYVRVIVVPKP